MKFECELIKDLLPLYNDGLCSNYTKSVVEEHIEECTDCKYLLKAFNEQYKSPLNAQDEIKKLNPLKKIKRRNRIITIAGIICTIIIITVLYIKLFQIGSVAQTSEITVENIEMFDDKMTFSIELSSNNSTNKIIRTVGARDDNAWSYTAFKNDHESGFVYIKANIALAWPFNSSGSYKMTFGFDEGGLGADSIKAIYLVGNNANDIKLIWEEK